MKPAISFVVPMWNREKSVEQAIRSCLSTNRQDIEVIVVDDASTDGGVAKVRSIDDERLRLILHTTNKGVCAARSTGILHAEASWIGLLDSDDELAPGAVDALLQMIERVPADRAVFASRRLHDNGLISPFNLVFHGQVSFDEYLQVIEKNYFLNCDMFICMRREALRRVPYPTDRVPELEFNLQIAHEGGVMLVPDALYLCHHGAANQLTRKGNAVRRSDHDMTRIHAYARILQAFPDQMKRNAPQLRQRMIERMIIGVAAVEGRRALSRLIGRLGWSNIPGRAKLLAGMALVAPQLPNALRQRQWR